jgi:hypothetical protein
MFYVTSVFKALAMKQGQRNVQGNTVCLVAVAGQTLFVAGHELMH